MAVKSTGRFKAKSLVLGFCLTTSSHWTEWVLRWLVHFKAIVHCSVFFRQYHLKVAT